MLCSKQLVLTMIGMNFSKMQIGMNFSEMQSMEIMMTFLNVTKEPRRNCY